MSTVIVSLAVGYEKWITDMIRYNREKWCSAQGLEYKLHESRLLFKDWPASWHKIPAILQILDSGNNALWIDADAAIISQIPIEDLQENIACAKDVNGWNLGVWYIPSTFGWVLKEMMKIGEADPSIKNHRWWEQSAFHKMDKEGKLPKVDQLKSGVWNSPEGSVIRHWPGNYNRWNIMKSVVKPT